MWTALQNMLFYQRPILILIIMSNILGTLYGYIWYTPQLYRSAWYFWPFIPDSPTATLFLVVSLILLLCKKQSAIIDTLAFVTLLKYGVWAVMMNFLLFIEDDTIYMMGVLLIISHGIMAIQAVLFFTAIQIYVNEYSHYDFFWVFHNDVIDYVFINIQYTADSDIMKHKLVTSHFGYQWCQFCS